MKFTRLLIVVLLVLNGVGCKLTPESANIQVLRKIAKERQLHWEVSADCTGRNCEYHVRVWKDDDDEWWFVMEDNQDLAVSEMVERILVGLPSNPDIHSWRHSTKIIADE